MKKQAYWIWYYGEFEIYHNLIMHTKRCDYGIEYPPFWSLPAPYARISFRYEWDCSAPTTICIHSTAMGYVRIGDVRYRLNCDIDVAAGKHTVEVETVATSGFSAIYCNCEGLVTDGNWLASTGTEEFKPVGYSDMFTSADKDPMRFPFVHCGIEPTAVERINGGYLYDYSREYFGPLTVDTDNNEDFILTCGESREEALDTKWAVRQFRLGGSRHYDIPSGAFRYVFVSAKVELAAQYERLPLDTVGSFSCNDKTVNDIWNTCAYTFSLNSREFYIDGIKRDRWVWSGDAYQSAMIGQFLYADQDITKRTLLALLGKPPYRQHVNTIVDYTMYVIIGIYEYYYRTGDKEFTRAVRDRVEELASFLFDGLNQDGLVEGNGWIFVDWADIDKDGPTCAEQILLWQTYKALEKLYGTDYSAKRDSLRKKIISTFWKDEYGGFIDCAASGKNHISRHANILAILYDFVDESQAGSIMEHVLENESIAEITTPYFRFFELCAYGKMGKIEKVQKTISSYWGEMLRLGATTIWEEFHPDMHGAEHYAMYGRKYEKSLCHAWGSGPIALLSMYCVGVRPIDVAYRKFEICPNPGIFDRFDAVVPVHGGTVRVTYADDCVTVFSTVDGGILKFGGKEIEIPCGNPVRLMR